MGKKKGVKPAPAVQVNPQVKQTRQVRGTNSNKIIPPSSSKQINPLSSSVNNKVAPPSTKQGNDQNSNSNLASTGKKLGFAALLFIAINSILGTSLFYLPGLGVATSGAASIIAWITVFILAFFVVLYMGELITLHPTSGGTYEFAKRAYGRFGSFATGWLIWLAGNFAMALNVVAAAEYFIPGRPEGGILMLRMIFAGIWIIALNFMAFRGVDAGSIMLMTFGIIATGVVFLMTIPSFIDFPSLSSGVLQSSFNFTLLEPFFQGKGVAMLPALLISLFLISEAFMGFEIISYMANEAKNPKKLHKVIISAIVICGVIVTVYIFSSLGTVPYGEYISDARPFALQALNTMGLTGQDLVVFGMYLVIVGAAAAWPITGSRLIQAMARDKLFIKHLAVLHPKHKSPYRAVYFQTFAVGLFAYLLFWGYQSGWKDPYRTIYLIYVLLSLLVISLILITVPILRRKEKELERPFKAPLGTIGPILLVTIFMGLIGNWIWIERNVATTILSMAGSFILLGIPLYFMVEMFYNPKSIVSVNEKLSTFVVLGEKIFFPMTIRNAIFKDMGDLHGKTLIEYGCSIGTLTKKLADKIGPTGRIFATDLSLTKVKAADKKTKEHAHVSVHHHPHLHDFTLKLPHKVDGVISVGMLSYMQHPQQILKSLAGHVKKGGEIVFVDFDKFFYFIPNVKWIQNDQQLKHIFHQAGFAVNVERKRSLLWQYIIITGHKV